MGKRVQSILKDSRSILVLVGPWRSPGLHRCTLFNGGEREANLYSVSDLEEAGSFFLLFLQTVVYKRTIKQGPFAKMAVLTLHFLYLTLFGPQLETSLTTGLSELAGLLFYNTFGILNELVESADIFVPEGDYAGLRWDRDSSIQASRRWGMAPRAKSEDLKDRHCQWQVLRSIFSFP